jgi:hypothetical protein
MRWVGSVAWDGYPTGTSDSIDNYGILNAASEEEFLAGVARMAEVRKDFTSPEKGWPWPWADSSMTDYAYAYDSGKVYVSREDYNNNCDWVDAAAFEAGNLTDEEFDSLPSCGPALYPDMTAIQKVDFGDRSGVIFAGR